MAAKQRIVIDQGLIDDLENLQQALEELYLGEENSYQVYVHEKHLAQLEQVFDHIIMKNGLRPVNFDYSLMRSVH
jgi:hypothetical protein